MEFTELSPEQVSQVNAAKTSGSYRTVLEAFIESPAQSADVTNLFPGKKTSTVVQGFKSAQRKNQNLAGVKVGTIGDIVALLKQ